MSAQPSSSASSTAVPPHYRVLGVEPSATQKEVERSYRKLSLQLHPDRAAYRDNPAQEAEVRERYQSITEAYAVLADPQKRAAYDVQFGVNFLSRVEGLARAIGAHNEEARRRQATKRTRDPDDDDEADDDTLVAGGASTVHLSDYSDVDACVQKTGWGDAKPESGEASDTEEDEEYAPEAAPPRASDGTTCTSSAECCRPSDLRLSVHKRGRCSAEGGSTSFAATMFRPFEETPLWGLTVEGHVLVHSDRHGGVPFPALIRAVNNCRVQRNTVIDELVRITTAREPLQVPDNEDSRPYSVLCLALDYTTDMFDVIGDLSKLTEDTTLERLLPPQQVAPELQDLLPGRAVLSVNGSQVCNATELRSTLKQAAEACIAAGHFARGIALQCASIHGLSEH